MRLAKPDFEQSNQIHQAGTGLINLFAEDLFNLLDEELQKSDGKNWLTNYRKTKLDYLNYNFKDPSNLLKELIRVSQTPLRAPIREKIPQKEIVAFFNRLKVILDDRNDWIHHNQAFNAEILKSLILNLYPVCQKMNLATTLECDYLLSQLDGVNPDVSQLENDSDDVRESSQIVTEIKNLLPEEEPSIGSIVDEPVIEFSYSLHLNGDIRDRRSGELLSDFMPETAQYLGALLISRKPNGGRIRITQKGVLVAYFEDHWGYLGKVNPDIWFPNHLFFYV
jgi:hypothetical protein